MNAITNELFLSSAMELHPYATLVGRPVDYYLTWAVKEWEWFVNSGMINAHFLINDGLNAVASGGCVNNNQTTWTYNQGVLLNGAVLLAAATGNDSIRVMAERVASATMVYLSNSEGVLEEPCGSGGCNQVGIVPFRRIVLCLILLCGPVVVVLGVVVVAVGGCWRCRWRLVVVIVV